MKQDLNLSPDTHKVAKAIYVLLKVTCVVLLGWSLYSLGAWLSAGNHLLITEGQRAEGTIVEVARETIRRRQGGSSTVYVSIVEFLAPTGRLHRFKDNFGGRSIPIVGDKVEVLFANSNPEDAIIDKGPLRNWLGLYGLIAVMLGSLLGFKRFSKSLT